MQQNKLTPWTNQAGTTTRVLFPLPHLHAATPAVFSGDTYPESYNQSSEI